MREFHIVSDSRRARIIHRRLEPNKNARRRRWILINAKAIQVNTKRNLSGQATYRELVLRYDGLGDELEMGMLSPLKRKQAAR